MKMKNFSILIILSLLIFCIMGNVRADETEKIICEIESSVDGVSGSFGFTMTYNPGEVTILENTTLNLSYSPSPEPAKITLDINKLYKNYGESETRLSFPLVEKVRDKTEEFKKSLGILVPDLNNSTKYALEILLNNFNNTLPNEFKIINLSIIDTPLGSYTITSIEIFSMGGVKLILDLNLDSQINTTLQVLDGSLDVNYFEWHEWGAKEITLIPSLNVNYTEVSASFKYYVVLDFVLRLNVVDEPLYKSESIPLKEMPFNEPVTSKITIDKSHTRIKGLDAELLAANAEIDDQEADLSKANKTIKEFQDLNLILNEENEWLWEIIEEDEPDYSLAFVGVGVCIGSILWFFIVFVVLKKRKKKRETQPHLQRVPPSERRLTPRYDEYQQTRPRNDDYQRFRPRHDDFQKPQARHDNYRKSRPRHNDYQKPPQCPNCRQPLRFVKNYESWYCYPCDSYPFDD